MSHLDDEQLEKYVRRQVSTAEMSAAVLHLDACPDCARRVARFSAENSELSARIESGDADSFHLDYDEHLLAFVENHADEATRELVETHTESCAACAFELRELREFAASFKLREIERTAPASTFGQRIRAFIGGLPRSFAFALAAVALVFLSIVAFRQLTGNSAPGIVPRAAEEIADGNRIPSNEQVSLEKPSSNSAETNELPANSVKKQAAYQPTNRDVAENENKLPESIRQTVRAALASGQIAVPALLLEISKPIKPRGGDPSANAAAISPNREVMGDGRPRFSWPGGGKSYEVEIFDENSNSIAKSGELKANSWTPPKALRGGKVYQWEVRENSSDSATEKPIANGQFAVVDSNGLAKIRDAAGASPLERGIVFASLGLTKEARREFIKASKSSPNGAAAKFLRQLEKYR